MRRFINQRPRERTGWLLAALPFLLLLLVYLLASNARLAANATDKLLPAFPSFAAAIRLVAFVPDQRTGSLLLWADTLASLIRLLSGLLISSLLGMTLGPLIGLFPYIRSTLQSFLAVLSMIPPLAVLPILFITLGLGEAAKITLIVIGLAPYLIRDMAFRTAEIPQEFLVKAQTLGASSWQILLRVALPMLLPRLLGSLRLSVGPAWLFLIAAEAIAATEGLGYRIFLVRRFLAMDVILPYVAWITFLAFLLDLLLARLSARFSPWAATA